MPELSSPVLQARRIHVRHGPREVIHDLSLDIAPRGLTAILGANGCGKSTLLRALGGLIPPFSGEVLLDGQPVGTLAKKSLARRLSLLPQTPRAPEDMKVQDLVEQGRYPHRGLFDRWSSTDREACAEALTLTDMGALADRPLNALSGGQRQRAWIAMTLAQAADILLLDEPTTYLDLSHQLELLALLHQLVRVQGKTIVSVLHDINQAAQFADKIVMMKDGIITASGPPDQVMTAPMLHDVFGVKGLVMRHPLTGKPLFLSA